MASPEQKQCSVCRKWKDTNDFYTDRRASDGCDSRCKACRRASNKTYWASLTLEERRERFASWKRNDPDYMRKYQWARKYGITPDEVEMLLAEQDEICAGCNNVELTPSEMRIDHDHDTGQVRGLLCNRCNIALGFMREDPKAIRSLADYIEGWK